MFISTFGDNLTRTVKVTSDAKDIPEVELLAFIHKMIVRRQYRHKDKCLHQ